MSMYFSYFDIWMGVLVLVSRDATVPNISSINTPPREKMFRGVGAMAQGGMCYPIKNLFDNKFRNNWNLSMEAENVQ